MRDDLDGFVVDDDDGMLRCECLTCTMKYGSVEGCLALCGRETRSCTCKECALRCDTRMIPEELKQIVRAITKDMLDKVN
jgi:hypothetical protein